MSYAATGFQQGPAHHVPAAYQAPGPHKEKKQKYKWVVVQNGQMPEHALVAGNEPDGKPLFVARANMQNGPHCGKVQPGMRTAWISWGGRSVDVPNYEVLVAKQKVVHWVPAQAQGIPAGAVSCGVSEGHQVYVGRAQFNGGVHPGKIHNGSFYCAWGPQEHKVPGFEYLTISEQPFHWERASRGQVPSKAVVGGQEGPNTLYIARAPINNGFHSGKVSPSFGGAFISWGGKALLQQEYDVLCASEKKCRWVPWNGSIPPNSVTVGMCEGQPVYVARANHQGAVHPGKLFNRTCYIAWGPSEVTVHQFEVLTISDDYKQSYSWEHSHGGAVPKHAVQGGHEPNGAPLYVCRVAMANGVHPGKAGPHFNGAFVSYGGHAQHKPDYEVLVAKAKKCHWVPFQGQVPAGAVSTGVAEGKPIYVARAHHQGGLHPGKLYGNTCYIAWGQQETTVPQCEILIVE